MQCQFFSALCVARGPLCRPASELRTGEQALRLGSFLRFANLWLMIKSFLGKALKTLQVILLLWKVEIGRNTTECVSNICVNNERDPI